MTHQSNHRTRLLHFIVALGLRGSAFADRGLCDSRSLFPRDPVGEGQLAKIKISRGLIKRGQHYPSAPGLKQLLYFGQDPYMDLARTDISYVDKYGSSAVKAKHEIIRAIHAHLRR